MTDETTDATTGDETRDETRDETLGDETLGDETLGDETPGSPEAQEVLRCPRDQSVLVENEYEASVQLDECLACGGRWLDAGELEKIQETVERDYRKAMDERPEWSNLAYDVSREMSEERFSCPACGEEMARMEYARVSQVVVDVCPECRGVWLDQGELERLEIFFERVQAEAPLEIPWYARLSLLIKGRRKR